PSGFARPVRMSRRIASAVALPPGSRVVTTSRPRLSRKPASRRACVDLPVPSPPSKLMKPLVRTCRLARSPLLVRLPLTGVCRLPPAEGKFAKGVGGALRVGAAFDGRDGNERHRLDPAPRGGDLQ